MTAIEITASTTGSATGPPSISPRAASITEVTGFAFTKAWSHPGIVSTLAKAVLANVNGRMIMNPHVFTDSVVRAVMPMKAMGQHITSPHPATEPEAEQRREAGDDQDAPDDPHAVRRDPPADHRRTRDGQRAEPVDHATLEVDVQRDGRRERQERHALDQDPRERELKVFPAGAGDGPAEHIHEQHEEHEWLDRHLDELLGSGLDVQQVAAGDRQGVANDVRMCGPRQGRGAHARLLSFGSWCASSVVGSVSARCPVMARNTSSRLGRRSDRSSMAIPSSSSRRTTRPSTDRSSIEMLTTCPSVCVPSSPSA